MQVARRLAHVQESATLAVTDRAAAMRRQGIDVISLSAGEPDFDTPEHIKEAAIQALRDGFTKYTAVGGILELREAIAARYRNEFQLTTTTAAHVLVSTGAKHAIYNLLHALSDPGDEVLFFSPYWVSYPEMIKIAGAVPVAVPNPEANGFRPDLAALERSITRRSRVLIVNSPCNPTGACYPREDLLAIAALAERHDLWVISDEIYERLIYGGARHHCFPTLSEDAARRTVVVNGMSKSYAMTGWRMGYAVGPQEAIAAATRLQGQATSNPTSIAQRAALAALTGDQSFFPAWLAEYDRRRQFVVERLRRVPGLQCVAPQGAFYVFINCASLFGRTVQGRLLRNDLDVATAILEQAHVALVPGGAFGSDQHVRLSYATSLTALNSAMDRLDRWAAQIG